MCYPICGIVHIKVPLLLMVLYHICPSFLKIPFTVGMAQVKVIKMRLIPQYTITK